jgi:hypothetical protein
MTQYISATEKIYRELSQRKPPQPKPARPVAVVKPLTRADVDAIIQRKRTATPEELEQIVANAKDLKVTRGEMDQINLDLSIHLAQRTCAFNGKRDDPNLSFIHRTLGLMVTPHGMIERQWFETLLRSNVDAIARCRNHRPPRCECWSGAREILWQTSHTHGDKSPEAWAALQVWEILEELEMSSRPERGPK